MSMDFDGEQYKIRGTKVVSPYPPKLTPAECRLVFGLQKVFDPQYIMADVYLPKPEKKLGELGAKEFVLAQADLLQIDCVALDERGIFVFESKDYVGWIYGHGNRMYWTQVSAYGKNKQKFYNPVKQNASHVQAVASIFGGMVPIYSIIIFGNEATLKVITDLPENCYIDRQVNLRHLLGGIKSEKVALSPQQMKDIWRQLEQGRINPNTLVREEHISEVQARARKMM